MSEAAVYELDPAAGFQWVIPTDPQEFEIIRSLTAKPLHRDWTPMKVDVLMRDESGRMLAEADIPWLGENALVLGDRAVQVLGPILAPDVELLPLSSPDRSFWLVHPLTVVDALLPAESTLVRFSGGQIMSMENAVFDESKLTGIRAFRLPDFMRGPIFLTDIPVKAARAANLSGVMFRAHRVRTGIPSA